MFKYLIIAALLWSDISFAWEPTKPVIVIIGIAPGSGNEISFRKASSIVIKNNPGINFIIENKPGGDAVVAQNQLMLVPVNGHTISVPSHMSFFVTNDIWQKDIKKFEWDSFINVVTLGKSPLALVAMINSNINTPDDFVLLIKNPTRRVNIAMGGGAHQMAFEYIMHQLQSIREEITDVKYPGPAQAVMAVASAQTEFGIMPIAIARPLIEAKKIKLIGLTSSRKLNIMPDAPSLSKSVPGLSVYAGWMISLPAKTPQDIVEWYQREFAKAISSREYQDWAAENFIITVPAELNPQGVKEYGQQLRNTFAPIVKYIK